MVSNYICKENIKRIANGFWILGIILLLLVPLAQAVPLANITSDGIVEIRGEAAQGPFLWDANNFPAFFYGLKEDIGTESLIVGSMTGRMIPINAIIYSTQREEVSFNFPNFGKYQVVGFMGDNYLADYTANTTPPNPTQDFNFSNLTFGYLDFSTTLNRREKSFTLNLNTLPSRS